MSDYEICLSVLTAISIILTFIVSLCSMLRINKRKELYLIKKEAIFEALNFLDDFLSTKTFNTCLKRENIITKIGKDNFQELTFRGRECFNKLVITCDDSELIDTFCKIILPQYYYEDKSIKMNDYDNFRMLCRKELGLKQNTKCNRDDIIFIASIK